MKRTHLIVAVLTYTISGQLAAQTPQAVTPTISAEQFKSFAWITGRWHGTGGGAFASMPAFFEEYIVVDDSTMRLRTYADSTFATVTDSTRFELRNGRLLAIPARGNTITVSRIAGDTVVFGQTGETLYLRLTEDYWRAIFGPQRSPGMERYFEMRRITQVP